MKMKHTCSAHIGKPKIGHNGENRSYNQIKMCMCVEFFFDGNRTPFCMMLPLILRYGLSFFFFSFFSCFWARIFFIFSFCIVHIFLHDEHDELCQSDGAFLKYRSQHMSSRVDEFKQNHNNAPDS